MVKLLHLSWYLIGMRLKKFIERVNETQASYLSELTGGTHLHVISAPSTEILNLIERTLEKKGLFNCRSIVFS